MNVTPYTLIIYEDTDKKQPLIGWLLKLKDKKAQVTIPIRLLRLSEGNPGDVKSVGDGVHELRITTGPGYRVYFAYDENKAKVIVLLMGGDKSTQKKDVKQAKIFWEDYQFRQQQGENHE